MIRVLMLCFACVVGCGKKSGDGPDGGGGDGKPGDPCGSDADCASGFACSANGECAEIPASCGDGNLDASEVCDGVLLGDATCAELAGLSGPLACLGDCSGYDTAACTCVPDTCEALAAECGPVDDGCGVPLECGVCEGWLECGFGADNVCGAGCPEGCPDAASCSDLGVCEGADLSDLVLDVPTVQVSGEITLNGRAPRDLAGCTGPTDPAATVTFVETTHGYTFPIDVFCGDDYAFGPAQVFPGTYDVSVFGDSASGDTNLPGTTYVAVSGLVVQADTPGIALDVPTVDVSGEITLNGRAPRDLAGCTGPTDPAATVTFVETTHGYTFPIDVFCGDDYAFGPTGIFPGTYDVSVFGDFASGDTNLPGTTFVAVSGLVVQADSPGIALDVPTVNVSGDITLNGRAPRDLAGCTGPTDPAATVTFVETTHGYTFPIDVFCGDDYAFGPTGIFPGTYDVSVFGDFASGDTNLPGTTFVAISGLVVQADSPGIALDVPTFDVSGAITLNGAAPRDLAGCTSGTDPAATVTFVETTRGYTFPIDVFCGDDYVFGPTGIFPGTYDVSVFGDSASGDTNLPGTTFVAISGLVVQADTPGIAIDVATFDVSGAVTLNGSAPRDLPGCTGPTDPAATVTFVETTHGYTFPVDVFCGDDYAFGPTGIFPGTYDVSVFGDSASGDTNLPGATYVALTGLVVQADVVDLALDVPTVDVAGVITLNGRAPRDLAGCTGPTDPAATVTFTEVTRGYRFAIDAFCGSDHAFGPAALFAGVYEVQVYGDAASGDSNVPSTTYTVYSRLAIQ